jgi:hypothetical protein
MGKVKVVVASIIATAVVFGSGISVAAAHAHAFSMMSYCASSSPAGTHSYVVATHTDNRGNVTKEYGTCSLVNYRIVSYEKCACGLTTNSNEHIETRHMNCGQ